MDKVINTTALVRWGFFPLSFKAYIGQVDEDVGSPNFFQTFGNYHVRCTMLSGGAA